MASESHRNELFTCLANARRRALLARLDARQTPVSACELAREVAARETDTAVDDCPTEAVQRVYISLYHTQLPKLASAEVIDYEPDATEVAEGPRFETAIELLETT